MTQTLTVSLPPLHRGQQRVRDRMRRFTTLACGRRWGKTRLGSALCVKEGLEGNRAWWVAPSYKMARVGWRAITGLTDQIPGTVKRKTEMLITLPTGGTIQVRSADDPDSLRGEGLDFVTLDECAFMKEEAWTEALRPALSDRQGRALFISTPKGRNWFWRLYMREGEEYAAFQFPSSANPYIEEEEIIAARDHLPERTFRQEYLAEFIDDAGGVFRRVMEAATAKEEDRGTTGKSYVVGVDWAKQRDFTVLTVLDEDAGAVVHIDRFNQIDYTVQVTRLEALCERFSPRSIVAERNSIGEPLLEQLKARGLPVTGFTTTAQSKGRIIDALALAFEKGDITIPADPVLIGELQAYERERLAGGTFRYNAPSGLHDDCVISLALAWEAKQTNNWTVAWG